MVAVRPVHRKHANDVVELIECVALTGAQAAKLKVFADSCPNKGLPVNLDTWKFVFRQDEGQHPSVPENTAFRLTHTKTSCRSSVFSLELYTLVSLCCCTSLASQCCAGLHLCEGLSDFCEVHIAFQSIEDLVNVPVGLRFG